MSSKQCERYLIFSLIFNVYIYPPIIKLVNRIMKFKFVGDYFGPS